MEQKAIQILEGHRTMAIATVRPDGWPQTTIVGYANDGLLLYFLISRSSQKLAKTSSMTTACRSLSERSRATFAG